jgi:hypothetical protein
MGFWKSTKRTLETKLERQDALVARLWNENSALKAKVQAQLGLIRALSSDNETLGKRLMEEL